MNKPTDGSRCPSPGSLLTDVTNLHDAGMRYQHAVGESPAPALTEPAVSAGQLPSTIEEATALAYRESPTMNAAIAGVWSADRAAAVTKAAFVPRLDLRARQDPWDNDDPIAGRYEEEGVIELVMSYNLYNGGSDRAERRRMQFKAAQAADQRDDACRVIREDVGVAYNELRALEEQMTYLDRHQQSIGRAREAYRRQFDIGQRTLLDMLDTENEYYQARRAYVIARREHDAAYTRALASMGVLVRTLELGGDLYSMELPDAGKEETPDMTCRVPARSDRRTGDRQGSHLPRRNDEAGRSAALHGSRSAQPGARRARCLAGSAGAGGTAQAAGWLVMTEDPRADYDRIAASWIHARRELPARDATLIDEFMARLPAGGRVLDLGCGTGRPIAMLLAARGFVIHGVDRSAELLAEAL